MVGMVVIISGTNLIRALIRVPIGGKPKTRKEPVISVQGLEFFV